MGGSFYYGRFTRGGGESRYRGQQTDVTHTHSPPVPGENKVDDIPVGTTDVTVYVPTSPDHEETHKCSELIIHRVHLSDVVHAR